MYKELHFLQHQCLSLRSSKDEVPGPAFPAVWCVGGSPPAPPGLVTPCLPLTFMSFLSGRSLRCCLPPGRVGISQHAQMHHPGQPSSAGLWGLRLLLWLGRPGDTSGRARQVYDSAFTNLFPCLCFQGSVTPATSQLALPVTIHKTLRLL